MNLSTKDFFEIAANAITVLGIPIGLIGYILAKRSERIEREYGTYDALDNKYIEFLTLCLQHPDLKITAVEDVDEAAFNSEQRDKRALIFEILICILERAFLMYKRNSRSSRKNQWHGWDKYVDFWLQNPAFRKMWSDNDMQAQYSSDFVSYILSKIPKDASA